ncbi:MAG: hypothetical protein M3304_04065, partial [Actinomycetota bacterium]|nr:hypothetical protein [Actinomycetota bacterium]
MVFQSTLPVPVGLASTPWELDRSSVFAGRLALAGGCVTILTLQIRRLFSGRGSFSGRATGTWGSFSSGRRPRSGRRIGPGIQKPDGSVALRR